MTKMCYIPDVTQTEVHGFIPDIFTVVKKGAVGNTQSTHCLSVDRIVHYMSTH